MGWESNNIFQVLIITAGPGQGLFMYQGAPGFGKLLLSIATTNGTDAYGNTYVANLGAYDPALGSGVQLSGDGLSTLTQTGGSGGPWTLESTVGGGGSVNLTLAAAATGAVRVIAGQLQALAGLSVTGGETADTIAVSSAQAAGLVLNVTDTTSAPSAPISSVIANAAGDNSFGIKVAGDANYRLRVNSDGSIHVGPGTATQDTALSRAIANMFLLSGSAQFTSIAAPAAQANPVLYGANNGQLAEVNGQGLQGGIEIAQSSNASHTVTQASLTQLSAQFTIPATDASTAGTTYRLTAGAQGTWGSTVQNLSLQAILAGAGAGPTAGINSGTFPASTVVNVQAEVLITIATTGAAGTFTETLSVWISDNSIATNVSRLVERHTTGNAINTTVANTLSLGALWNATTGAPTITCEQTIFERVV